MWKELSRFFNFRLTWRGDQNRPEELPSHFPQVSSDLIKRLEIQYIVDDPQKMKQNLRKLWAFMVNRDPFLGSFLLTSSELTENPTQFLIGAAFTFKALQEADNTLPPVSEITINTHRVKVEEAASKFGEKFPRLVGSDQDFVEEDRVNFVEGMKEEFEIAGLIFPSQDAFIKENPALVEWWLSEPTLEAFLGGFLVYTLKQNQFCSE